MQARVNPDDSFNDSFGQIWLFFEDAHENLKAEVCRRISDCASEPAMHHDRDIMLNCDEERLAKASIEWLHVSPKNRKWIKYFWLTELKKQFEVHGDPLRCQKAD